MAKTPKKPALPLHKILLALTLGTVGGGAAFYFSIPLPWMLGAMLSTTVAAVCGLPVALPMAFRRSEEHTSELQSLMRISYAVFCLKKKSIKIVSQQNLSKYDY